MYETFYQLSADPFRLSPDPAFCFPHRTYRKAMTYMLHALHRAEGFIMITGRPGTGKTTLINDLIQTLKADQVVVSKIVSTQLTADDLLNLVAYSFNLDPEGGGKAKVLIQVERFLKQQYQHGRRPLLIVDEAQDMGDDALEELRLLTNIQLGNHQLLQVFLVGQEQLRTTVNTPSLEQLHQRLIAATLLEPLDTDDTKAYIKHRLRRVNWKGNPLLSTETYAIMQRYSQGIPRRINQICSRLFLHGCIEEKHRLGLADLKIVVEELQQELLLPLGQEGINEAASWPAEQYGETYEEEPQTSPPAPKTVLPATESLPGTERAGQKRPTMAADTPLHMPAREPVSVAGPGAGNVHRHEKPAANKGTRRLRPWRLTGLSGLLAGLLLMIVYMTERSLVKSEHAGGQKTPNIATGEFQQQNTKADEDMHTGIVVRKSSPPNHAPKSDLSENETRLHESAAELVQAHGQGGGQTKALQLEEGLRLSGFLIERLHNHLFKVNLSNDRLFDIDSAQIKDDVRPALEKLADVLREHDDLSIQIVGQADSSGPADLYLSDLRVKALAEYLVSQGLADPGIRSAERGDQNARLKQLNSDNPSLKRRLEIHIRPAQEKRILNLLFTDHSPAAPILRPRLLPARIAGA